MSDQMISCDDDPYCAICRRLADGRRSSELELLHLSPAESAFFSRQLEPLRPGLMEVTFDEVRGLQFKPPGSGDA